MAERLANAPDGKWIKSSLSFSNGNCVEAAKLGPNTVGLRDSKAPDGPSLTLTRGEFQRFTGAIKGGSLNLPRVQR